MDKLKIQIMDDYKDQEFILTNENEENNLTSELSPFGNSPKKMKRKPKSYIKKIRSSPSFQSLPLTKTLSNLSVNSLNKLNLQNEENELIKINTEQENIGFIIDEYENNNNKEEEVDFFDELEKTQFSEPKSFLIKKVKKPENIKKENVNFEEFDEKESIMTSSTNKSSKNQLFHENPPIELVKEIMKLFLGENLDNPCYQFTRKMLEEKKIMEKLEKYIPELRKYYLKCKQNKYLDNLDSKKVITILRQLIRIYGYQIHSTEKYQNGAKFLLYKIDKLEKNVQQKTNIKKSNFTVDFD